MTVVVGGSGDGDAPCGTAIVTVLDGATAAPLGPASAPAVPVAGGFSAPIDVQWAGGSGGGGGGLRQGARVALRIDLTGAAHVYSFTYSSAGL